MALTYSYPDAYLARFCTEEREARALADVAVYAADAAVTFSDAWLERLVILQTYILACLENQADAEGLFTAKLKTYRAEFSSKLPQAVLAANEDAGTISNVGLFSIPLERS